MIQLIFAESCPKLGHGLCLYLGGYPSVGQNYGGYTTIRLQSMQADEWQLLLIHRKSEEKGLFSYENKPFDKSFGGDKRDRTADLMTASHALSHPVASDTLFLPAHGVYPNYAATVRLTRNCSILILNLI